MALHVRVLRARGLHRADCVWAGGGASSPYITLRILPDGAKRVSKAKLHTEEPVRALAVLVARKRAAQARTASAHRKRASLRCGCARS
jgi:hypothetical protein